MTVRMLGVIVPLGSQCSSGGQVVGCWIEGAWEGFILAGGVVGWSWWLRSTLLKEYEARTVERMVQRARSAALNADSTPQEPRRPE